MLYREPALQQQHRRQERPLLTQQQLQEVESHGYNLLVSTVVVEPTH